MIDVCLILATLNFKLGTNQAEDTESSVVCSASLKSTLLMMFVTPNFNLVLRNSYECLVGLSVMLLNQTFLSFNQSSIRVHGLRSRIDHSHVSIIVIHSPIVHKMFDRWLYHLNVLAVV